MTINEIGQLLTPQLEALGWIIELKADRLDLLKRLKNGKPRKTATVSIAYAPTITDAWFNGEAVVEDTPRPNRLPWSVRVDGHPTTSVGSIEKAMDAFISAAEKFAPNHMR